jgi:dihydroxyacetone kinase-like predicted kinase
MIPITKFKLEFFLHAYGTSTDGLKHALSEFAENIGVEEVEGEGLQGNDYKVGLLTEEPQLVFDACAQFGRIRSIKIEEEKINI